MTLANTLTRLNKFISETGICSRREADRLIEEGQVKVNGRVAEMGLRVSAEDRISVRGKPLKAKPAPVYLAYNKPVGITCTTDPEVPENIVDAVNYKKGRIFPIGRLDKPSEGLILLTNDGDIVNKILRAGNAHDKEYVVTVDKPFGQDFMQKMASGVPILGTVTQPCRVRQLGPKSFNIILTQGMNRQIRRMTEYLGYEVVRLKRTRIMNITLADLKLGQWRPLNKKEMALINQLVADSVATEEASTQAAPSVRKTSKPPRKKSQPPRQDRRPAKKGKPAAKNSGKKPYPGGKSKKK